MASQYGLMPQSTLLFVLIFCKCIFLAVESATLSIVTDKESLISFKSRISLEPPNPLSSWDQKNSSPCNWTGVVCNNPGQRVVGLDLSGFGLEGSISPHIGNLSFLRSLQLQRNQFTGMLPNQIGNLFRLRVLNMSSNRLEGVLPSNISQLTELQILDLMGNQNITGRIPDELSYLTKLQVLKLGRNNLYGAIPPAIGKIPWSLHNLTNIQMIRMAHNLLEGTVPPGLGNLPFLEMYNIGFNRIVSSGEDGLSFITFLKNSTRLNFLAIDGNQLEGVIPDSIGNLSKVLLKLYMGGNRFYGNIPTSISDLSSLTLLNLSYNSLSGGIPPEIGHLQDLQMLGLAGNQISGSIPNSLGNLQNLNQIDLSRNSLVGKIPNTFGNFQKLLSMDLSNNRFNGNITRELFNLPSLSTILNLSKNLLSGPLPEEVSILEKVVAIDLSDNNLSGNIPSSISKCKSLEKLFLARNVLSGPIPSTLEEVKGLDTLDLSSNQLSGSIPVELQKLQALQSLNLSFNNLEGIVPSDGVFKNLSNVHLEGNPKLCLHLGCVKTQSNGRKVAKLLVIVSVTVLFALCFILGSLFYLKKSKTKITRASELRKGQHQMVSYNDLRQATGNFNQENFLGNGSFGSVYKGYLRQGIAVAVKVLDNDRTSSWKSFLAECEALRNVRHRNLVRLITSCSSIDFKNMEFLALVYEFLSNGSLEDWVNGKRMHANGDALNVVERLNVAIDVAFALDYLHHDCEVPVVHCDLKPSNILLGEDMTAKVGDFGLARLLMQRTDHQHSISYTNVLKGSIGYIPPEYGMGKKPSTAGDVYSFGVMLLELFTGKKPTHESFVGGLNLIGWVQSAFPADISQVLNPEMLQLMSSLYHNDQPISPDIQHDCLVTILGVGLSCTVESSDARISIRSALNKLKSARANLFKSAPKENTKYIDIEHNNNI
uniref:non-specific serine/threonine protein kinase n=1 Tax=Fagus sylvatica TaxID=28930 RepID=A0A2N9IYH2_FAGSY